MQKNLYIDMYLLKSWRKLVGIKMIYDILILQYMYDISVSSQFWNVVNGDLHWLKKKIFIHLPSSIREYCLNCRYKKSKSCPFCRGSLKRVRSRDLWVLTSNSDVADKVTLDRDNVNRFYHFIDSLPLVVPDNVFVFYYDYYLV
jgi:uncharacterized protein YbaR (Trm112 family)